MSKSIPLALKTHLASEVTTVAFCWRLERRDGTEFFFTSHDEDLVIDGDTYEARGGFLPSEQSQNRALAVDNSEATCFLDSEKIVEAEIHGRLFDEATIDIFIVNWADLAMGRLYLAKGWILGEIEIRDVAATAEVRGKAQKLQQEIVELYSPACRADLGDARCTIDIESSGSPFRYHGSIEEIVLDRRTFLDFGSTVGTETGAESGGDPIREFFRFGRLTWLTGANEGLDMEVKRWDPATGEFELFEKMPYGFEYGDEFLARFGCNKTVRMCREVFNNVVNFRGEPFIPGPDTLTQVQVPPSQ